MVELIVAELAREDLLLMENICPKCGGKVIEKNNYVGGGTENQPEPSGITYTVGYDSFDCKINNEYFSI